MKMKKVNVYTHYDDSKKVIAKIIPNEKHEISERTYKNLLKKRTVGGIAGIYTDADFEIYVRSPRWGIITTL